MDLFKTAVNLLSAKDGTLLQISDALLIQKSVELGMPLKGQDPARLVNSLHVAHTTRSHAHPPIREAWLVEYCMISVQELARHLGDVPQYWKMCPELGV